MNAEAASAKPRRTRRFMLWVVAVVLLLALAAYLGIGAYVASSATEIDPCADCPESGPPARPYEEFRFPAREDGVGLAAWFLPAEDSRRAIVLVHGRDASRRKAISGNFVKLAETLNDAGYAVLLFDLRGHGESEGGNRYTFGVKERRDVLGAVDWLLERGFEPGKIGVLGISMGGASAVAAAAQEPAIGALVLESTLADLPAVIEEQFVNETGFPTWFIPGVLLMNRLLFGYDMNDVKPVEDLPRLAPRPVLIIHCLEDEVVNVTQARKLSAAVPEAPTWYVEACDHAEIYRDHAAEYDARLLPFLEENLP
jgi:pimeloyl-ACP methyl ester carboxylesterase